MASDGGRRGGREARRQLRAAPLERGLRPVRPGLEGGRYQPLSRSRHPHHPRRGAGRAGADRHGAGAARPASRPAPRAAPSSTSTAGCASRARWSRTSSPAPPGASRSTARTRATTWSPGARKVHFGTAGAAVHMVDLEDPRLPRVAAAGPLRRRPHRRRARPHPLLPAHRWCRATWSVPWSWTSTRSTPASPARPSMSAPASAVRDTLEAGLEILHMVAGGEAAWRARPFVSLSCCFVVPPLRFAEDACRGLEVAVARRHAGAAALGRPGRRHLAGGARRARWCRPWPRCWPASSTSTRSSPARPRSSAPGRSSRTCAPAPCRAAAPSRRCYRPPARRWRQFYDLPGGVARRHERFQAARRAVRRREGPATTRWSAMPAPT